MDVSTAYLRIIIALFLLDFGTVSSVRFSRVSFGVGQKNAEDMLDDMPLDNDFDYQTGLKTTRSASPRSLQRPDTVNLCKYNF